MPSCTSRLAAACKSSFLISCPIVRPVPVAIFCDENRWEPVALIAESFPAASWAAAEFSGSESSARADTRKSPRKSRRDICSEHRRVSTATRWKRGSAISDDVATQMLHEELLGGPDRRSRARIFRLQSPPHHKYVS